MNLAQELIPPLPLPQTPRKSSRERSVQPKKKNAKVQTQYRESSAQTSPWQPAYKIIDEGDPEILKLDFLKWGESQKERELNDVSLRVLGSGLPVGMHELRLIERARMKRKWEQAMPPVTGPETLNKRRAIVEAIERDEWAFREQVTVGHDWEGADWCF